MKKVLITGSAGFIGGYLVEELLRHDYTVIGLDNYSKYGKVKKSYDGHPRYACVEGDAKDARLLRELMSDCQQVVAGAAMIGGIGFFHKYAYDLLAENERILASTFDAAIWAFQHNSLERINVISSSMVFERTVVFPTPEGEQLNAPPPLSTYGFQKLACEYFARGALQQYGLPFTIIRPFNCVGVGESAAIRETENVFGNIRLAMSHVVPDLIQKVLKNQEPLGIFGDGSQIRHYTYGGDLARGIRCCMESPNAINEDFNISTAVSTTVLELAEQIWRKIKGDKPLRYVCHEPFPYDVRKRVPDTRKAERVLGFKAETPLAFALDEIIPWVERQMEADTI